MVLRSVETAAVNVTVRGLVGSVLQPLTAETVVSPVFRLVPAVSREYQSNGRESTAPQMPSDQLAAVKVTSRVKGPAPFVEPSAETLPSELLPWSSASSFARFAAVSPESSIRRALSAN